MVLYKLVSPYHSPCECHVITIIDSELNNTFDRIFKLPYTVYYSNCVYPYGISYGYVLYFNSDNFLFFNNDNYERLMSGWINDLFTNPELFLKKEYLYERNM